MRLLLGKRAYFGSFKEFYIYYVKILIRQRSLPSCMYTKLQHISLFRFVKPHLIHAKRQNLVSTRNVLFDKFGMVMTYVRTTLSCNLEFLKIVTITQIKNQVIKNSYSTGGTKTQLPYVICWTVRS